MRQRFVSRNTLVGCFILLQSVDFLLTWVLIGSGVRGDVYEANPLALSVLSRFGWAGLGAFKLAATTIAVTAVLLLWRKRSDVARRVTIGLCLIMLGVVGYSGVLLVRPNDEVASRMPTLEQEASTLNGRIDHLQRFVRERTAICRALLAGSIDTNSALDRMAMALESSSVHFVARYREKMPAAGRSPQLAAYLYHYSSRLVDEKPHWGDRLSEIRRELEAVYPEARLVKGSLERRSSLPWERYSPTTTNLRRF